MSGLWRERLLLIDTCGEVAGVTLCAEGRVVGVEEFVSGRASAEIVAGVRRLLTTVGWALVDLDAVGVVSGPGSFTGVRTGLAAAKGFCEGSGLRLIAVSRLEVLAEAAGQRAGWVALDAGRGEVYVREVQSGREWVCSDAELLQLVSAGKMRFESHKQESNGGSGGVSVAEERVRERMAACTPQLRQLRVMDGLAVVQRRLEKGPGAEVVDANYVHGERDIYRKSSATGAR